jgi:tetratricopeptide (TPR) repeat protein
MTAHSATDPKMTSSLQSRATALADGGDVPAAIAVIKDALAVDANDAALWETLGRLHGRMGDLPAAIECLTQSVAIKPDVLLYLTLGQSEIERKNYAAADAWMAKAEALDPTAAKAPTKRGDFAARRGFSRDAVAHYRRAFALEPRNFRLLHALSYTLASYAPEDAIATVETFLATPGVAATDQIMALRLVIAWKEALLRESHGYPSGFARAPSELGYRFMEAEVKRWEALARLWLEKAPEGHAPLQMVTQSLIAQRKTKEAEPYFAKLRVVVPNECAGAAFLDAAFHANLAAMPLDAIRCGLPAVHGTNVPNVERVVFAACDYRYAKEYAAGLLVSFAQKRDAGTLFVLHIFDMTDDEALRFSAALSLLGDPFVVISREWTGLRLAGDVPASPEARAYYHAIRFIRLREILDAYPGRPVWGIDADVLFNQAPRLLFDALAGHEVLCLMTPGRPEIQNQFAAGAVGIAPTAAAHAYMHNVAAYIFTCWQENRMPWGLDQTALYCVYVDMAARQAAPDIGGVTHAILSNRFADDAVLWSGKCSPDDPQIAKYRAAQQRFQLPGAWM